MTIKKICVIGLGHFGLNLSLRLAEAGAEVLAVDNHQEKIDLISDKAAYAVCMDAADEKALRSLSLTEMDAVIVAIGEGFESSLMTTALLQEIGVKKIFNRVISPVHERLLKLMGVDELLVPEADSAERFANRLMIPGLIESFKINKEYGIFEIEAPAKFAGKTLLELNLRKDYSLNLITIKRKKSRGGLLTLGQRESVKIIGVPQADTKINKGDILFVFGKEKTVKSLLED